MERKTFAGKGATLALHRIQPGHELRPHSHPNEQIVYMLGGTADFTSVTRSIACLRAACSSSPRT